MIGQKNLGVKHFFLRATRVQVQEILNLGYVSGAAKNTRLINLVHTTKSVMTEVTTARNLWAELMQRKAAGLAVPLTGWGGMRYAKETRWTGDHVQ